MKNKSLTVVILIIISLTFLITPRSLTLEISEDLKITAEDLQELEAVTIEWVYDGDTFRTVDGRNIRLIGIDTAEMNWSQQEPDYYAEEAFLFSKEMLLGEKVYLKLDQQETDHYGRQLAYVFLQDGTFFNAKLLKKGYAVKYSLPPNVKYMDLYSELTSKARSQSWGLRNKVRDYKEEVPVISFLEAHQYIEAQVIVKGKIILTHETENVVFLNFSENFWNTLSIVIFSFRLKKFDYNPADYLREKEIKVLGKVTLYEGTPQIIVEAPYQILILEDKKEPVYHNYTPQSVSNLFSW